jgi:ABC-type dipeptide/oligopeptide/nickel transport system permease subunit
MAVKWPGPGLSALDGIGPAGAGGPVPLALRKLLRQPRAWAGIVLVGVAVLGAVAAPWLTSYSPVEIDLQAQLQPPSAQHIAGTDFYGRDMASRLLYGGRTTLAIAAVAVILATAAGTTLGLVAGFGRGWLGQAWISLIDLMLAFPTLLLALLIVGILGPGLGALVVAVGIAAIPIFARMVRATVLTIRSAAYIEAALASGARDSYVLVRHLLPGVIAPMLTLAALEVGLAILSVAALGFLGLGAAPPQPEWGLMLYEGRQYISVAPWTSTAPGLAITLTVLGATLLGDAISTAMAPGRS